MYKTRNTGPGTECGEREEYGECYIPGNIAKHFGECPQTFRGMSSNIPGNVTKHSGEYHQRFHGMPTTGWLSNSTVGRLSIGCSFIKLFVVDSRFYNGQKNY